MKDIISFNEVLVNQLSYKDAFVRCNKGGIISFHEKFDTNRVKLKRSIINSASCDPNEIMASCFSTGRYKLINVFDTELIPIYRAVWFKDVEFFDNFDFPVMTVKFDRTISVINDFTPLINLKAEQALPA